MENSSPQNISQPSNDADVVSIAQGAFKITKEDRRYVPSMEPPIEEEVEYLNKERVTYFVEEKRAIIRGLHQDIDERKKYAELIFGIAACWLSFVGFVLFCVGLDKMRFSEPIILALIGTTTVNVLGLFYIVANYLFPKKENTPTAP